MYNRRASSEMSSSVRIDLAPPHVHARQLDLRYSSPAPAIDFGYVEFALMLVTYFWCCQTRHPSQIGQVRLGRVDGNRDSRTSSSASASHLSSPCQRRYKACDVHIYFATSHHYVDVNQMENGDLRSLWVTELLGSQFHARTTPSCSMLLPSNGPERLVCRP